MPFTQDFRTQRRNYTDGQTRVGETGRLWYDSDSNTIRVGDGETAGGVIVGGGGGGGDYTLPTATTTVKGGVKIDGQTIVIDNQQISVGLINYSSISNPPTLLSDFTNDAGFITSSALSGYATQTYVTTRGYLTSYTETDPVFIAHAAYNVTNTKISNWDTAYGWGNHASAGYLTSVTNGVYTTDTGTVTNTMLAGSIANNKLTNSSITVNGTSIALGASGTVTAAADTLTGSTLASGVTASSLTSVGTLNGLTINSTTGGNFFTISGLGRPSNGNIQTWRFFSNTNIGGPGSYIEFPDGSLQNTAWTGTVSYSNVTDTPTIPADLTDLGITDGTNGQVLTTDGAGGFSFEDAAGGAGVFSNEYSLTTTTNNATETELLVGGSTRIPVATNKSVNYIVNIAARRTDSAGDYAMFEIRGVAANSNGTVSDIGSVYEVVVVRTNAGYLVDVRADDTNNSVNVYVTGVSGHTINWRAVVQTIEV